MNLNDNLNLTQPTGGTAPALGLDPAGVADETAITGAAALAELLEEGILEELEVTNARLARIGTELEEQTSAIREQTSAMEASAHASYEIARHLDRLIGDWRKVREERESIR